MNSFPLEVPTMFRPLSTVLLLLAYVAGMGHCTLAAAICQTSDPEHHSHNHESQRGAGNGTLQTPVLPGLAGSNAEKCDKTGSPAHGSKTTPLGNAPGPDTNETTACDHENDGHPPHGADCLLDNSLAAPPNLSGTDKLLALADNFPLLVAVFLCPEINAPPPAVRAQNPRDDLVLITHGWQFLVRATGLPRAP